MMKNQNNQIVEIQQEIDHIKEYVQSELCKKCDEMKTRLQHCERLLHEYSRSDVDNTKSDS